MPRSRPLLASAGALFSIPAALVAAFALQPAAAQADIRRCQTPDGNVLYTDRTCEALGAVEQHPTPQPPTSRPTWTCAHTVRELTLEVTAAIDSRNPDALVRLYDWHGQSTREGYRIAERLADISERPLIGVAPLLPVQDPFGYRGEFTGAAPLGLQVQQSSEDGDRVLSTTFGLARREGCWRLRL